MTKLLSHDAHDATPDAYATPDDCAAFRLLGCSEDFASIAAELDLLPPMDLSPTAAHDELTAKKARVLTIVRQRWPSASEDDEALLAHLFGRMCAAGASCGLLQAYRDDPRFNENAGTILAQMITDVAFQLVKKVWFVTPLAAPYVTRRGSLFFSLGGINSINPFRDDDIKNEGFVYAKYLPVDNKGSWSPVGLPDAQGYYAILVDHDTAVRGHAEPAVAAVASLLTSATSVYWDFAGSMTYATNRWLNDHIAPIHACGKLKGLFDMNGVFADKAPETLGATDKLNRMSCCTMNGFYHPQRTYGARLFCKQNKIPVYLVANNQVEVCNTLASAYDALRSHNICSPLLKDLTHLYYLSGKAGKSIKLFDLYVASAICAMANGKTLRTEEKTLVFDNQYGFSLVAESTKTDPQVVLYNYSVLYGPLDQKKEKVKVTLQDPFKTEVLGYLDREMTTLFPPKTPAADIMSISLLRFKLKDAQDDAPDMVALTKP